MAVLGRRRKPLGHREKGGRARSGPLDEATTNSQRASGDPGDDDEITFGQNANQTYHAYRYIDRKGLSRGEVSDIIRNQLKDVGSAIQLRTVFNGYFRMGDLELSYSSFRLAGNHINVSSIRILK